MPDSFTQLITRQHFPGHPGWVRPAYDGHCTVNLINSLLTYLGIAHEERLAFHDEFNTLLAGRRKVLLLVLDGLGWVNLEWAQQQRPRIRQNMQAARRFALTTVFPSTTSASLSSLTTGVTPAEHGVIGFLMYFPEYRRVFNMLNFHSYTTPAESLLDFGFQPAKYLEHPTIFHQLRDAGKFVGSYTFAGYIDSGLSHLLYGGLLPNPYVALGDLLALTHAQMRAPFPQFVFAYWSTLDTLGHTYGAGSEAYLNELEMLSTVIEEQLRPQLDDDTALLLVADHGHIDGNDSEAFNLNDLPELAGVLRAPPAGEGRAMHLFIQAGLLERARELLAPLDDVTIFTKAEFLDYSLLGDVPIRKGLDERIGDYILFPHGSRRLLFEYQPRPHTAMVGRHGGLSPDEMIVPLLIW